MKKIFLFILFLFLINPGSVNAVLDPRNSLNNKFGIHVVDENDFESAASLVNSSGGDWGYVTFVIQENDRNPDKWNSTFEKLAYYHLIPIIRLASSPIGDYWKKPEDKDISAWSNFLSQLNWVTENRYIIIFNEPNHAKEWGMEINPAEYARMLKEYSQTLKTASSDFFILPAGLDASANNTNVTMNESNFLKLMADAVPEIWSFIDGWTSHSYPNPGFSGLPNGIGKGSLKTYKWEINHLKNLGLNRDLPIFITETGWPHQEGQDSNNYYHKADIVAEYIEQAANSVWTDTDIVMVSPFLLNYQSVPFSNFSWQIYASDFFYPQYDTYRSLPKIAGEPKLVKSIAFINRNSNKNQN